MTAQRFEEIKVNAFIVAMALIDTIKERQSHMALSDMDMLNVVNGLNGVFRYEDVVFTHCTYKIFIDSTDLNFSDTLLENRCFAIKGDDKNETIV